MSRTKELKMLRDENEFPGPEVEDMIEVKNTKDVQSIAEAAQEAIIFSMKNVLGEIKKEQEQNGRLMPGLTWEQLDLFLTEFNKQKPQVIVQKGLM